MKFIMFMKHEDEIEVVNEKYQSRRFSDLQKTDSSVVVGVENELESAAAVVHRVLGEGQNASMKLENLGTPKWFDKQKFKKGQDFFFKNYYTMFVSKLSGLLIILNVPSALKILILSGKSSTPAKAYRRYMNTISSMLNWYKGDLSNKDNKIYKVLLSVRAKHKAAARKSETEGEGTISQKDLALTQFGFMGLTLLNRDYYGIRGSEEDIKGFIHFWRTIGYFMGLEDKLVASGYVLVVESSTVQVIEICEILVQKYFMPFMEDPTEDFIKMSNALLDGIRPLVPLLHKDGFMEFVRCSLGMKRRVIPSMYATIVFHVQIFLHKVLNLRWLAFVVRPLMNGLLRISVYANCSKYPLLAMLMFGKETCVEIEIEKEAHCKMEDCIALSK